MAKFQTSRTSAILEKEPSPKLTPHSSPRRQLGSSGNLVPPQTQITQRGTSPSLTQSSSTILKGSSSTASLSSLGASVRASPKEILKSMLSSSSSGMTMFQVLYNLEVGETVSSVSVDWKKHCIVYPSGRLSSS